MKVQRQAIIFATVVIVRHHRVGSAVPAGRVSPLRRPGSGRCANLPIARRIGAIKAINGNAITLAPDSGPEVAVTVQPNARLLRIAPGEKDLKNATPIQLQDLQVGDTHSGARPGIGRRQIDRGFGDHRDHTFCRSRRVSEQERQDWQKRGIGGPVSAVDPAAGTVTISVSRFRREKDDRRAHLQEHGHPPLRSRLRQTRRCEAQYAAGSSASATNCARAETAAPTAPN